MTLSRPRSQFAHRRTVRLIVEDDMEIDALEIAKSLPDYAEFIQGIVPQFGGKCFDITLNTAEAAVRLATAGYDYGEIRKPLRLLSVKTVHVSVFVSVEFPDEELLTVLEQYGELKTRKLRRLHFHEDGFQHIERGIRVAEFNKITRDLPKKVVLGGIEIGFKYSGQPATCYRCQSTEHVVRDCPKRRRIPPRWNEHPAPEGPDLTNNPENDSDPHGEGMEISPTPELFTPPSTYASVAASSEATFCDTEASASETHSPPDNDEAEASTANASRGRKRDSPSPTGSDDERGAPPKKPAAPESPANTTSDHSTAEISPPAATVPSQDSPPTSGTGLKSFITALAQTGFYRSTFMSKVPATVFYECRGYYLFHKYGPFTEAKGRKHKVSLVTADVWERLAGTVRQDAYAELLRRHRDVRDQYNIFHDF